MGLSLWATPLKRVAAVPANAPRPIPQHCCTLELQQEGGAAPPAGAPASGNILEIGSRHKLRRKV